MRLWAADDEQGLMLAEGGACRRLGPPCGALCAGRGRVYCAEQRRCVCRCRDSAGVFFDLPLPTGVCAMTVWGDTVCALSADADSITAFSAQTGELKCCAPAGVYPRDLCVSRQGRFLAVAGGASGSVLLLDEDMRLQKEYRLPGTVCGVCCLRGSLLTLCAVERNEIETRLLWVSLRGAAEEVFSSSLPPACLCSLPGNGCAVGCMGRVFFLSAGYKLLRALPCPCPVRIRPTRRGPLICDPCRGTASLADGPILYRGPSPQDALPLPRRAEIGGGYQK